MAKKIIYCGNINHAYGCEGNILKSLEKLGHNTFPLFYPTYQQSYDYYNDILNETINDFSPDIVLTGKCMGITGEILRDWKKKYPNTKFIQWTFDYMGKVGDEDRAEWWIPQAKEWDLCINSEDCMSDEYRKLGINHRILRQGFDQEVFKKIEVTDKDKEMYNADVMFVGHVYNRWREEIVTEIPKICNFRHYDNLYLKKLNIAGNCTKIAIATNFDDTQDRGWSNRVSECMGMGMCVLSPYLPSMLKEGFKDVENIAFYHAHDIEDLKNKIKELLSNEDMRKQIAEEGYKLAHSNFTWDKEVNKLFKMMKSEGLI